MGPEHGWQQPHQRCQHRPVSPVRLRPLDLTPQNRDLMTQHHDLRILRRLVAARQEQQAKDPDHDQIQEAKTHRPRSCPNLIIWTNGRAPPVSSSEAVQVRQACRPPLGAPAASAPGGLVRVLRVIHGERSWQSCCRRLAVMLTLLSVASPGVVAGFVLVSMSP
jgi:hypothetical protein